MNWMKHCETMVDLAIPVNKSFVSICALASGSKGNALYIGNDAGAIIVDQGLSGKEFKKRLDLSGLSDESLKGIVISHEHTDHVKGAGILCRKYNIPLYINQRTLNACQHQLGPVSDIRLFDCGTDFSIQGFTVHPFSVSHDAVDPAGFSIRIGGVKIGVATDLGIANLVVIEHLKGSSALVLEANHEPHLLMNNPNYPWPLKQRVKGRKGHLSNAETAALLKDLMHPELSHIILAHLSEENNCPKIAMKTTLGSINGQPVEVLIASQTRPTPVIQLPANQD